MVDIDFAISLIGNSNFVRFNNEDNNDICLDITEQEFRLSDNDAIKVLRKISRCDSINDFQALEKDKRDRCIKKLKEEGLSIRQISRITGVGFAIVRNI